MAKFANLPTLASRPCALALRPCQLALSPPGKGRKGAAKANAPAHPSAVQRNASLRTVALPPALLQQWIFDLEPAP